LILNEINFNSKGCFSDFGATLNFFKSQPPIQKVVIDDVPGMNGMLDFSTVASGGEIVFTQRIIHCSIQYFSVNKGLMMVKYGQLLEWLLSGKNILIFTGEPDMQYMARVETIPTFDVFCVNGGILVFDFTADPFKYGINLEGNDIWDLFNFETDYVQDIEFDVVGTQTVSIYNSGRIISPTINCNATMTAIINGYTTSLINGDNNDWLFKLQPGANTIIINGTGHISFNFRKTSL